MTMIMMILNDNDDHGDDYDELSLFIDDQMLSGNLEPSLTPCSEAYSPSANLDTRTLDASILLIGINDDAVDDADDDNDDYDGDDNDDDSDDYDGDDNDDDDDGGGVI